MLKKFSSFTLLLGIFSTLTCQGVSGAETTFKDRSGQVVEWEIKEEDEKVKAFDDAEGKALDELEEFGFLKQDVETEAAKTVSSETKTAENLSEVSAGSANQGALLNAVAKQLEISGEELVFSHIDENYDAFVNWLSNKLGLREYWYYLFHTYEGDKHSVAKEVICFILLTYKWVWCVVCSAFSILFLLLAFLLTLKYGFSPNDTLIPAIGALGFGVNVPLINYFPFTWTFFVFFIQGEEFTSNAKTIKRLYVRLVQSSHEQEIELVDQ